jgi:hypothetical protein
MGDAEAICKRIAVIKQQACFISRAFDFEQRGLCSLFGSSLPPKDRDPKINAAVRYAISASEPRKSDLHLCRLQRSADAR